MYQCSVTMAGDACHRYRQDNEVGLFWAVAAPARRAGGRRYSYARQQRTTIPPSPFGNKNNRRRRRRRRIKSILAAYWEALAYFKRDIEKRSKYPHYLLASTFFNESWLRLMEVTEWKGFTLRELLGAEAVEYIMRKRSIGAYALNDLFYVCLANIVPQFASARLGWRRWPDGRAYDTAIADRRSQLACFQ